MANDGHVKIGTELDAKGVLSGLKETEKTTRKTFEDIAKSSGKTVDELKADAKKIAEEYQKQGYSIPNSYKKAYADMGVYSGKAKQDMQKDADDIGDSHEKNSERSKESWKKALSGLGSFAQKGFTALGNAAVAASKVAVEAIAGISAAVSAVAGYSIKVGSEFETSLAQLSTIADTSAVSIDQFSDELKDLASETGQAASDLALVAYNAISAGTDTADAMEMVKTATDLATGGFTSADSALSVLTTALNAYGDAAGSATDIADSLITVQNLGVTTVDQLASSMGKAIATGSAYGVNLSNLESSYISLTKQGINTAEATTYLSSMLKELGDSGSSVGQIIQEKTGKSFGKLMEEGMSLGEVMNILAEDVDYDAEALMNLWGSAEAGKAANAIINEGLDSFEKNLKAIQESSGATEAAVEKMSQTFNYKAGQIKQTATNMGLSIYESMQEGLAGEGGLVDWLYGELDEMSQCLQNYGPDALIDSLGGFVSDFIGKAAEYAPQVIEIATSLISGFTTSISDSLPEMLGLGAQILFSLGQGILTSVGQFASLGANVLGNIATGLTENLPLLVSEGNKLISSFTESLTSNLPGVIDSGVQIVTSLVTGFAQMLPELLNAAVEGIISLAMALTDPNTLTNIIESGITLLTSLVTGIMDALPKLIEAAPTILANLVSAIVANLPRLVVAAVEIMRSLAKGMLNAIAELLKTIPKIYTELRDKFKNIDWGSIGKNLIEGIKKGISEKAASLVEGALDAAKSAVNAVKNWLGIASPSKKARDLIGKNLIAGIGVGIEDETPSLVKKSVNSAQKTVESMQGAIAEKSGTITADVGYRMYAGSEEKNNQGETKVILEKGSITGDVIMDGKTVGELVAPTVDVEIEKARRESER